MADHQVAQLLRDVVIASAPSGATVVLHVPSGTYLSLDENGSAILDLLIRHRDAHLAASVLAGQFAIPLARAEADVATVVGTLTDLKPVRTSQPSRPTIGGAVKTARDWWRLPLLRRAAVAKVVVLVIAVELGLRTTDVATLASRMRVPLSAGTPAAPPDRATDAATALSPGEKRAYWATGWVLDRWIYDGTCLRRALVSGFVLRRHHPVLCLGLIGDGQTSHAWVEAEGMTFNDTEVTDRFTTTDRPGSPARSAP